MATQRFPFICFWCHFGLFDTTYYAAITIGKCNHVVQSGGAVKMLYSSIIQVLGPKLFCFYRCKPAAATVAKEKNRLESLLEIIFVETIQLSLWS